MLGSWKLLEGKQTPPSDGNNNGDNREREWNILFGNSTKYCDQYFFFFQNAIQENFTMEEVVDTCLAMTGNLYLKACRGETKIVNEVAKRYPTIWVTQ